MRIEENIIKIAEETKIIQENGDTIILEKGDVFRVNERRYSQAQKDYMQAKAYNDTIEKEVEDIKNKILRDNEFYTSEKYANKRNIDRERILSHKHAYRMSDEDFQDFLDLLFNEYRRKGYKIKRGRSLEGAAGYMLIKAEEDLFAWGRETIAKMNSPTFTAKDYDEMLRYANLKQRAELIDITMKLDPGL